MNITRREIILFFIATIIIGVVVLTKPAVKTEIRNVKGATETIQSPPKIVSVTKLVPDGIAEDKLDICRGGLKDAIVRINDIRQKVIDSEEPISKDDTLFNANDLAAVYGKCF